MSTRSVKTLLSASLIPFLFLASVTSASPPSPEARAKFIREGTWEKKVADLRAFEAAQPPEMYEQSLALHLDRYRSHLALSADAVDTARILVLLVDFPDFRWNAGSYPIPGGGTLYCSMSGTPAMFDSLLFSEQGKDSIYNPTGSWTEWYLENSYGSYYIEGDVFGWFTMPQDYSWYVGDNDGLGRGSVLASDAVMVAHDQGVNFAPYAPSGSAFVPGLAVVHAGPGAEQGAYGIWSHRSSMSPSRTYDGVYLSGYTMQPEERFSEPSLTHMGVFCHEWGHVLGLPDWYDVAYNEGSSGLGSWCVMAGGSWNDGGKRPAHFNCFSKYIIGFNEMQWLEGNLSHAAIPQAETSPIAYALKENPVPGQGSAEVWFVENRQRVGFDEPLPGRGLLIYHFDALMPDQTNPYRYRLALEEADGRRDLAFNGSDGQSSDPFPGFPTNNREFHEYTVPDSRTNGGLLTEVSVLDISDSDSIMYADLNVYYAMPYLVLAGDSLTISDAAPGGDGDGLIEQGETVDLYLEVDNLMRMSYHPELHLDIDNPDVQILENDRSMGTVLNPTFNAVNFEPIVIQIPGDFVSAISTFTFTITSDSSYTNPDGSYTNTFQFQIAIGKAQILIVDDDNGRIDDRLYAAALDRLRLPFEQWEKLSLGSPTYADLAAYQFVFWMSGSYRPPPVPGGTLTADDVAAMRQYLDNGGNLMLGSFSAPLQLQTLDSAFMADYLHANLTGSKSSRLYIGESGSPIGDGLFVATRTTQIYWNGSTPVLEAVNGGQPAFIVTNSSGTADYGYCGVTYDGTYRTAFLSFGVELLRDEPEPMYSLIENDSLIARALGFFVRGAATAVEDDSEGDAPLPHGFSLNQNYPNPFNPSTTISYTIGTSGAAQITNLSVFNVLGQKVATLVDEIQNLGAYTVSWQGRTSTGSKAASGVYFYRLTHGDRFETKKMILMK